MNDFRKVCINELEQAYGARFDQRTMKRAYQRIIDDFTSFRYSQLHEKTILKVRSFTA